MNLKEEIAAQVDKLSPEIQEQVLRFTASLTSPIPKGESGAEFRRFAGLLDPVSAREMRLAIEEECERVDASQW